MFKRKTKSEIPFNCSMLPHTRKEMWFDVVKLHYLELISMGLVMFAFFLPVILNMMLTDLYSSQLSNSLSDETLGEQWSSIRASLAVVNNTSTIINIPALVLAFVGLSGLLRIMRQYAWGEIVTPFHDFALGIKQNGKQTALLAVVIGLVNTLCVYLYNLAEINENVTLYYASSALIAVALFFLLPVGAYMLVCIPVYGNTFMQNFVQSVYLYVKALWKSLWALICCGSLFLLYLIPNMVTHFAVSIIYILGSPFILLGWFLFAYNRLDEFVNKEKHPEIVNKGLYSDQYSDD